MAISVGFRVMERALVIVQYASMVRTAITGSITAASTGKERGEVNNLFVRNVDDNNDNTKLADPDISMRKEEETPKNLLFAAATFVTDPAKAV